ncbi:MAG: hypothetical protein WAL90_01325, partial [Desulfobacterales bacterium]
MLRHSTFLVPDTHRARRPRYIAGTPTVLATPQRRQPASRARALISTFSTVFVGFFLALGVGAPAVAAP